MILEGTLTSSQQPPVTAAGRAGDSLRWFRYGSSQVNISSGHMRRPWLLRSFFLMVSMMMMLRQRPVVDRSMRWRGPGPLVDRSPRVMMMMMRGRRPDIRSLPRSTCWSWMGRRINTMLGVRAGPSRRGRRSGPLPTRMAPGWVTSPGWLVTSRRSTMVISVTTLITVWTVAIWSSSPGWAIGPWGSIYHRHTGWDSLAGLLIMVSGRPVIRSFRRLGRGGCLVFSLLGRPVNSLFDGWGLQSVLRHVQLNWVIHRVVRPLRGRCHLPLLLESFVQRSPRLR